MNILLACEHFYPQGGGVAKFMHEVAKRLIGFGHQVEVVTSFYSERNVHFVDGIKINPFKVSGNDVNGLHGEVQEYQDFLVNGKYDCLMVMAAQQWTLDAMLPVLPKIPYKKVHIPCGYSSFYLKSYKKYYEDMKVNIKNFDHLIYNSTDYRDINFARENGCKNIHIIPAGASETEFDGVPRKSVRPELNISPEDFVFLTVGAPAYHKGHKEALQAFLMAKLDFPSVLVLNGNYNNIVTLNISQLCANPKVFLKELAQRILGIAPYNIKKLAERNTSSNKKIIFSNLPRQELISLFYESNLFLFPSHIEYSPLVIFECLGAGLPFLSVPVGNLDEIIEWTSAGEMCTDVKFFKGRTFVNPKSFSIMMEKLSSDKTKLEKYRQNGREAFLKRFNWGIIAKEIEAIMN